MNRIILIKGMLVIIVAFCAFKVASDIVERLGTDHKEAQHSILNNLIGRFTHEPVDDAYVEYGNDESRSFRIPYLKLLPSIIKGDQQGAAKEVCQYLKNYINSEEFISDYQNVRNSATPVSEPYRYDAATIDGLKVQLKETEAALVQMKANNMSEEYIKQAESSIEQQRKTIAEQSDPTPNKTKWQQMYPENPSVLVKARLNEYIKLAATVDFNAKLTEGGRVKKFVNPAYEAKSLKWKAIYRSGKEVSDIGVEFAKAWLQSEIIAANKIKMSQEYPEVKKDDGATQSSNSVTTDSNQNVNGDVINDNATEVKPKNQVLKSLKAKTKSILK